MAFKTELEFQTRCLKTLKKHKRFVRNIPDIGNTKKPFDASWNWSWRWVAFEFKLSKNKKEPDKDHFHKKLYPHQIASLLEFQGPNSYWRSFVICAWEDLIFIYWLEEDWSSLYLHGKIKKNEEEFVKFLENKIHNATVIQW